MITQIEKPYETKEVNEENIPHNSCNNNDLHCGFITNK